MCKYCDVKRDEKGFLESNINEVLSFNIGIAEYVVTINRGFDMTIELDQYHLLGKERYEYDEDDYKEIKIKYCPFCGKEVEKIEMDY